MKSSWRLITINESISCSSMLSYSYNVNVYMILILALGPLIAVLNGICVYIFQHKIWKNSSFSRILKILSIVELCMGLTLTLQALIYSIDNSSSLLFNTNITAADQGNGRYKRNYGSTIALFLSVITLNRLFLTVFQIARNWTVVLLAAYRYDRVSRPLAANSLLPDSRIRIIIRCIILFSILFALPRMFEYGITICKVTGYAHAEYELLTQSSAYRIAYFGIIMFIMQSGGPVICLCVLSIPLIRIIVQRRKLHRVKEQTSAQRLMSIQMHAQESTQDLESNSHNLSNVICHKKEHLLPSGDRMIVAVCVTFFVMEIPSFFSKILNPYLENAHPEVNEILSVTANLFICMDSLLNAFVYTCSNPAFRKIGCIILLRYRRTVCTRMYKDATQVDPIENSTKPTQTITLND